MEDVELSVEYMERTQRFIIGDFTLFDGNKELMWSHLVDLGKQLPPLPVQERIPKNLITSCLSRVWLVRELRADRLWLRADSESLITKGLVSLLVRVFSSQLIEAITKADFFLFPTINQLVGVQRSNGFYEMWQAVQCFIRESLHTASDV